MPNREARSRFCQELEKAREEGRAVAVYCDVDADGQYDVGFVEQVDENDLCLACLTPRGESDGRRHYPIDSITRVDRNNGYLKKLQLLSEYRDSVCEKELRPGAPDPSLRAQLEKAMETNTIVQVLDGSDYGPVGFVRGLGDDYVEIERIDAHGQPDGEAIVMFDTIAKAHFGRRSEQVLEFLYRYNVDLKRLLGA